MLDIGRMDKRITFLKESESIGEFGQDKKSFVPVKTVWATVKALRGTEYYEALRVRPEMTYKITCRWTPGITGDMRIKYKNHGEEKILEIIGDPNDVNGAGEFYEMEAKEYTYANEDHLYPVNQEG